MPDPAATAPEQAGAINDVAAALTETTNDAPDQEFEAFSAIWDKYEAERQPDPDGPGDGEPPDLDAPDGDADRPRDERGRFISAAGDDAAGQDGDPGEAPAEDAGDGEGGQDAADTDPSPPDPRAARLPVALREQWATLPEEARTAIDAMRAEHDRKSGEYGEQMAQYKPVADRILQAAKQYPQFQGMTPDRIAEGAVALAAVQADLERNPVETLLNAAKQYGAVDHLRAALDGVEAEGGAPQTVALQRKIADLEQRLEKAGNPETVGQIVEQQIEMRETERTVQEFAAGKPEWALLEPHIPDIIKDVKEERPDLSGKAILEAAWTKAIEKFPTLGAGKKVETPGDTPAAAAPTDPKRAEAARRAASVNLRGRDGAKPKPRSDRDEFDAVWRKHSLPD